MVTIQKKTKKGVEYSFQEAENLAEAISTFGEENVFKAWKYAHAVAESDKINRPPTEKVPDELRAALKDPAVRAKFMEILQAQLAK